MKNLILTITLSVVACINYAQITGTWTTYDDNSGKARSQVSIIKAKDGKYYGKVLKLLVEEEKGQVCQKCKGKNKDKPIEGLIIIGGLTKDGEYYKGGEILDPENGKFYQCKIWREGDELKVRGYAGVLYRTQTWKKAD